MKFWTNSYYNFIELFIEHYKRMNQERSNSHNCSQYWRYRHLKCMKAFGVYTYTLEMTKVHNFFIFFFSLAVHGQASYKDELCCPSPCSFWWSVV